MEQQERRAASKTSINLGFIFSQTGGYCPYMFLSVEFSAEGNLSNFTIFRQINEFVIYYPIDTHDQL